MAKMIISLIISIFLTNTYSQKKSEKIDLKGYRKYARKYVERKLEEAKNLPDSLKHDSFLINEYDDVSKMEIYSKPIFKLKTGLKISSNCFEDYINFKNDFSQQIISIYVEEKLVCQTEIMPFIENNKSNVDKLSTLINSLLLHKESYIYGARSNNLYGYSAKLEQKFFTFLIHGINVDFIYDNQKIYGVNMLLKNKKIDFLDINNFLKSLYPKFVSINKFMKKIGKNDIWDKQVLKIISNHKNNNCKKCNKESFNLQLVY